MPIQIELPLDKIETFCKKWKIVEFSLFGSVLREDFGPDSDVDVLVTFAADEKWDLLDIVRMAGELKALFRRDVDVVEEQCLRNPFRRREILRTKEVLYAA